MRSPEDGNWSWSLSRAGHRAESATRPADFPLRDPGCTQKRCLPMADLNGVHICGSTPALMDAGVPPTKPCQWCSNGFDQNSDERYGFAPIFRELKILGDMDQSCGDC